MPDSSSNLAGQQIFPSKADEPDDIDQRFVELLAAYDESLKAGLPDESLAEKSNAGLLSEELKNATECLRLLEQFWPHDDKHSSDSQESPTINQKIGRFRLVRKLGQGGCGSVFEAFDTDANRSVALKVPRTEFVYSPEIRRRFVEEARAAASLSHPHVVSVYEAGEMEPVVFIASSLCRGPTLARWMEQNEQPTDARLVGQLFEILADAVDYTHRNGICHRDLKPTNVLLFPLESRETDEPATWLEFVPQLTDFGLAKLNDRDDSWTHTGAIIGTPDYMAPEQALGQQEKIGPATDIFSLGVMMYEMLSGKHPFRTNIKLQTLHQTVFKHPEFLRKINHLIPREMEAICHKCLEKEPQHRYSSAAELAQDLRWMRTGAKPKVRPIRTLHKLARWTTEEPKYATLAITGVLLLLFIAVAASWHQWRLNETREFFAETKKQNVEFTDHMKRQEYVDVIRDAFHAWRTPDLATARRLLKRAVPGPHEKDERGFEWYYLNQLCKPGFKTFQVNHGQRANGIHISPDGAHLASCGADGRIEIWEIETESKLVDFAAHESSINAVEFSPDGNYLASVGDDGQVKLWNASNYRFVREFSMPTNLRCLNFSPDSTQIAAAGGNGSICIWDVYGSFHHVTSEAHDDTINTVAFSPDGKTLASGSENHRVKIWDVASPQKLVREINVYKPVRALAFSSDGEKLITTGGLVNLWDVASGEQLAMIPCHRNFSDCLATSSDGKIVATGSADRRVATLDIEGKKVRHFYIGHTDSVVSLAFESKSSVLASLSSDGAIHFWRANSPPDRRVAMIPGACPRITADQRSNDDAIFISCSSDVEARLLKYSFADQTIDRWDDTASHTAIANKSFDKQLVISNDGSKMLVSSPPHIVALWDIKNKRRVDTFRLPPDDFGGIAFSPTGTEFAVAAESLPGVYQVDLTNGQTIRHLKGRRSVAYSPDGTILAAEVEPPVFGVGLWDAKTGELLATLGGHRGEVYNILFSDDGRVLVSTSADRTVKVWDIESRQLLYTLRGHTNGVLVARFTPDQKGLVTASSDDTLRIWDIETGREMLAFPMHSKKVESLVFSNDGQTLAAVCSPWNPLDPQLEFWDAPRQTLDSRRD